MMDEGFISRCSDYGPLPSPFVYLPHDFFPLFCSVTYILLIPPHLIPTRNSRARLLPLIICVRIPMGVFTNLWNLVSNDSISYAQILKVERFHLVCPDSQGQDCKSNLAKEKERAKVDMVVGLLLWLGFLFFSLLFMVTLVNAWRYIH